MHDIPQPLSLHTPRLRRTPLKRGGDAPHATTGYDPSKPHAATATSPFMIIITEGNI